MFAGPSATTCESEVGSCLDQQLQISHLLESLCDTTVYLSGLMSPRSGQESEWNVRLH
jgi:hypothetical protein